MNANSARLAEVSLDDRYLLREGRAYMTGVQALVRLALEQRRRDVAAGHDTAGYVSGYRGSPLGAFDQQLRAAGRLLPEHRIHFQPGVNEDLAATACWGTQQAGLDGEANCDGVFALWYGKGPGVDRSGDALRHGNLAGTAPLGGVLCLMGDDHTCESSTTAHQSEYAMVDAQIPVLNPAGVQEILDFGLLGLALSRYSGCWVGLKCVHDTVEAAASVDLDTSRVRPVAPSVDDFQPPADGLHIRWPDTPLAQEARLHGPRQAAVLAWARANRLDRAVWRPPRARVGIVTTGKSCLDVRQALDNLGIDESLAERLGVSLYKVAMSFPLEPHGIREFCDGLERVVVVEEKRGLVEAQLKEILYGTDSPPRVVGKRDEVGAWLFPSHGRLDSNHIAIAIGERLLDAATDAPAADREALGRRVDGLRDFMAAERHDPPAMARTAYFCPGCPHSSSTHVPDGSRALAGIGCHYLVQFMERDTARYTQMGAEGASWIGQAPFSTRRHMFQNMGDGTYFHSGLLPIRAAVAADTPITFKLLYNDAVAMTGGQAMDGPLTVPMMAAQVHAEGVRRVVVVTDEPHKYPRDTRWPPGCTVHHRDELDAVQRSLREVPGVTVLIYDQTCAAEKRRRRKRGRYPDPPRRLFINQEVCEGCGDCGVQSNCVAVVPVETPLGRKRAIDQSACNKDYSCLKGFCPSFVSVRGGDLRRRGPATAGPPAVDDLPLPTLPALDRPWNIVVTGVGGTGVITIAAVLGMAAHLEGKGVSVLDMTGLAQKGGAVFSHLRVASKPADITATRIPAGGADLMIGGDLVVSAGREALRTLATGRSAVVMNSHASMPGEFTRNADLEFPAARLRRDLEAVCGTGAVDYVDAHALATALLGDAIAGNLLLTGVAWQRGRIPLSAEAVERAIGLNGVAVPMNLAAFRLGRRLAAKPDEVFAQAGLAADAMPTAVESVEALVERHAGFLAEYQDAALAGRYREFITRVRAAERERAPGREALTRAVASAWFRALAVKDEYEVARLYTSAAFRDALAAQFEGDYRLGVHLAPPLLARRDPATGVPRKREFGPWVLTVFRWLAGCRRLRGTWLDPFGWTAERRRERAFARDYRALVEELVYSLDADNHSLAVELATLADRVRGYGHVKMASLDVFEAEKAVRLERWRARAGKGKSANAA